MADVKDIKLTMERFQAVPYQLQYQRKYGGKKDVQI